MSDHNVYLSVLLNFFVDEDEDENKLFSDDDEEITSPDLDEPNFNEMKELKSFCRFLLSLGFVYFGLGLHHLLFPETRT